MLTEDPIEVLTEPLTEVLPIRPLFSRTCCRELPTQPTGSRGKPRHYDRLLALKTVLVNNHADSPPATIGKAAHHSPAAIHLYIGCRAHNISGKRDRKIDRRPHRHIGVHAE